MRLSNLTTSELLAILDSTRRLAERRLVQPLMVYVAATVFEIIPAERCLIVLFGEDGTPTIQIAQDRQGQSLGTATDQMSQSILENVRTSISPLHIDDALADMELKDARSVRSLGIRSVMCVPLVSYGQAIGAIYVENRSARNQFSEASLVPLILFSHQVVVAFESAQLYESLEARIAERTQAIQVANVQLAEQANELRKQSIQDSLTGLYNRRYFSDILPQLFDQERRCQRSLVLACIDIDNFKQINDTFFHAIGDRVLQALADMFRNNIRQTDSVARIGGEEFAIIMPKIALSDAISVCERLRTTVEQRDWDMIAPGLHVTISIGVADAAGCSDEQELLRRTDRHLYTAKHLGKNQVVALEEAA